MNSKNYYVYILASERNGTLYVGITNDLKRRIYEHKNNLVEGFTKKYNIHDLVYYEETTDINSAIEREKNLKKWNRKWKTNLIEKNNPDWNDRKRTGMTKESGDDKKENKKCSPSSSPRRRGSRCRTN